MALYLKHNFEANIEFKCVKLIFSFETKDAIPFYISAILCNVGLQNNLFLLLFKIQ